LNAADDAGPTAGAVDAAAMSLTQLADHIEQTHHQYLKRELPRLSPLVEKIAAKHGPTNENLVQLSQVFAAFREELESHMVKEERILFPLIRQIDANATSAGGFHCGSIDNPIRVMELEHQHAGDAMEQMRELTDGYTAPADACNTYRAVMQSLAEIETDMHQHVHKENNVLFPRASRAASGG
jgi:regulator of cell morphogenesis and NO signaling